jgi:hypothetical protein
MVILKMVSHSSHSIGANSILPDISNPSVFYTEKGAVMIERVRILKILTYF